VAQKGRDLTPVNVQIQTVYGMFDAAVCGCEMLPQLVDAHRHIAITWGMLQQPLNNLTLLWK
jgi:hypothetical protein